MKESSPLNSRKICDKMHFQAIHSESSDAFSDQSPTLVRASPVQPLLEQNKPQTEIQFVNEDDVEALGAAAPPLPTIEEPKAPSANTAPVAASKTDSPSRKKGEKANASQCLPVHWGLYPPQSLPHPKVQDSSEGRQDISPVQSLALLLNMCFLRIEL